MKPAYYQQYLEFALGVPFTHGNHILPLKNGVEIFPAMLDAIAKAKDSIEFLTHVYWQGDIALQFARALAERAEAGVRVRVLLDAYGARAISPECLEELKTSAVELRWFRPLRTIRVWRTDKRTHRKIMLVDKTCGFTGGVGIADEWCGDARSADEWRDTHFQIVGPAVAGLNAAFLDNWNEAGAWSSDKPKETYGVSAPGSPASEGAVVDTSVQIVRSSSTVEWTEAASMFRVFVAMATESLTIVTPYFVPDDTLVLQLCNAVKRGVDVQIMLPGAHCDSRLSQLAGFTSIETLLNAGVRIYQYNQTLLHLKLLIVDGVLSSVGSTNLNHRSMGKDEECNANIVSKELASVLMKHFDDDTQEAELLSPERWRSRSILLRVREFAARLLIEQL
ncbi:MAG: phospholipase D-like domain-containing protein [Congregibacter sp.]